MERTIAWFATLICLLYSSRLAVTFVKKNSRLFTVLALFSCVWALLLPYYSSDSSSELFSAYSGFLTVYIGGLLVLEADHRENKATEIVPVQRVGLVLLLLIAAPSGLSLLHGPQGNILLNLNRSQTEIVVATLLDIAGYMSVSWGVYRLCGRLTAMVLGIVLAFYITLDVIFTIRFWPSESTPNIPMTPEYYYLFAAFKLIFTGIFATTVAYEGMTEEEKRAGVVDWVLRFFKLRT